MAASQNDRRKLRIALGSKVAAARVLSNGQLSNAPTIGSYDSEDTDPATTTTIKAAFNALITALNADMVEIAAVHTEQTQIS